MIFFMILASWHNKNKGEAVFLVLIGVLFWLSLFMGIFLAGKWKNVGKIILLLFFILRVIVYWPSLFGSFIPVLCIFQLESQIGILNFLNRKYIDKPRT